MDINKVTAQIGDYLDILPTTMEDEIPIDWGNIPCRHKDFSKEVF